MTDNSIMQNRRMNPRMLCADLVKIEWRDKGGSHHTVVANLEDISLSGACLQLEEDVPLQSIVTMTHEKATYEGRVRYCIFKDIGYFLGVEFEPGYRWTAKEFKPMHLLDPRRLGGLKDENASTAVQGVIAS
jgi:hypothetical protein